MGIVIVLMLLFMMFSTMYVIYKTLMSPSIYMRDNSGYYIDVSGMQQSMANLYTIVSHQLIENSITYCVCGVTLQTLTTYETLCNKNIDLGVLIDDVTILKEFLRTIQYEIGSRYSNISFAVKCRAGITTEVGSWTVVYYNPSMKNLIIKNDADESVTLYFYTYNKSLSRFEDNTNVIDVNVDYDTLYNSMLPDTSKQYLMNVNNIVLELKVPKYADVLYRYTDPTYMIKKRKEELCVV